MYRVLLIDDDPELAEMLTSYMESEGFSLHAAYDGKSGVKESERAEYSMILLDVMLPDTSGFNVLTKIRASSNVPVIMLTGRGEEIDRVVGLEMGADDYVSKPFPMRELLARMRAVLRRYDAVGEGESPQTRPQRQAIQVGSATINRGARQVTLADDPVHLTSTEFGIIEQLALNMGAIVERDDLMTNVLGRDTDLDDYVLNVHMSNLRRKLGNYLNIKTIRGRGYLLATPDAGAA